MNNTKHKLLPSLVGTELGAWLRANSIESFDEEIKRYFTPEEIAEFEHESSSKVREMNRLNGMLKAITEHVKKGGEEDLVIEIPASLGTKALEEQRRQNDDFIDRGYETEEVRIFGLVDQEAETMEYFTAEGTHVAERSRGLTPKEKMKFVAGVSSFRDIAVNE